MSILYVVATPIGNLGDITLRAIETLKNVDVVAAEDTRHTLELLNHLQIKKHLISCRAQNEAVAAKTVISILDEGKDVAFASDAGTPCVSDPGAVLVEAVRQTEHKIVPIPGASAATAIWSVAGSCGKSVLFEGFLSVSPGKRRKRLRELLDLEVAIILYESPFRVLKVLEEIADIDSKRMLVVGRELTKLYEEVLVGTGRQLHEILSERNKILGEFVILIHGKKS
ncbi:MAG: 16S rRNA (cytidine(1402)-2'-O)-methyltransferase [Spirochaetaceae bacterium]|nr:16S rRNA (cytidine(1402)-2'-O)-methyltransferase [Spirochaetaceae bacterium]